MKLAVKTACFFALISCLAHFYLAKRAYQLSAGLAEKSAVCHISENINCDQALLSPYAKIFNISLSSFGFAFNLIVFLFLLFSLKFNFSDYRKNLLFYLSSLIALSSVGMAVLSLLQSLYCPVCWGLYLFSFIVFTCLFFAFKPILSPPIIFTLQAAKEKSSYLLALIIFFLTLFLHISFMNSYDLKDKKEIISALLEDWHYEPSIEIPDHHLMQKGEDDSSIVIIEFADFLCPACKKVQAPLQKIFQNFPDIKFYFFVYPLDNTCNDSIPFSRSGLSCELSKAIVCAKNKAWDFHDFFFENQNKFISAQADPKKVQSLLDEIINRSQLDKNQFSACMQESAVLEKVKLSAEAGAKAKISGTPNFFINGKKIQAFDPQLINKIYYHLKSQ